MSYSKLLRYKLLLGKEHGLSPDRRTFQSEPYIHQLNKLEKITRPARICYLIYQPGLRIPTALRVTVLIGQDYVYKVDRDSRLRVQLVYLGDADKSGRAVGKKSRAGEEGQPGKGALLS